MAIVTYTSDTEGKCTVTPSDFTNTTTQIIIEATQGYKFAPIFGVSDSSSPFLYFNYGNNKVSTTNASLFQNQYRTSITMENNNHRIVINHRALSPLGAINSAECRIASGYPIEVDTDVYLTLTKNLSHCTITPSDNTILITGDSQILTLSPDTNYHWTVAVPTITYNGNTYNFTQSGNNYVFDLQDLNIASNSSATISAIAEQDTLPVLTLTKNLTNCYITPTSDQIEIDGGTQLLILTCNQGYQWTSTTPTITYNGTTYNFTVYGDNYIFDLQSLNITSDSSASITASAEIIPVPVKTKSVTYNLTHCSISPRPSTISSGDTYTLTVTADNGYQFTVTPTIDYNNQDYYVDLFTRVTDSQYQYTHTFTDLDLDYERDPLIITAYAQEVTPITTKYGCLQVYKVTSENMLALSKKRFRANNTVGGVTYADVDLGLFITQFKRIFFDVQNASNSNIMLGLHDTEINVPTIYNDDVTLDLGTVTLNGYYGNELDCKIYKINLVLPFYGIAELDNKYMNKTIHIVYKCNVITGYADISVFEVVDNTDIPIEKYRAKISQQLPYIINVEQLKSSVDDLTENISPKIILQKQNVFIGDGYETVKNALMSQEVGRFTIRELVECNINCTQNEKKLIENLLKSGVEK